MRHGRWYLLCWSHTKNARRLLGVYRITAIDVLDSHFTPPAGLGVAPRSGTVVNGAYGTSGERTAPGRP